MLVYQRVCCSSFFCNTIRRGLNDSIQLRNKKVAEKYGLWLTFHELVNGGYNGLQTITIVIFIEISIRLGIFHTIWKLMVRMGYYKYDGINH